jgi:hypothetical protein
MLTHADGHTQMSGREMVLSTTETVVRAREALLMKEGVLRTGTGAWWRRRRL